jgi:hypothetical protein
VRWLLERFTVGQIRSALGVLSVLLFLAAITIFNLTLAERRHPEFIEPRPPSAVSAARDDAASIEDLTPIWRSRWGEPKRSKEATPAAPPLPPAQRIPPAPPRPPRPTLADRFEIKGLVSGSNGSVVLLDRQSGKQILLFGGDPLPENLGRLVAVADDEATFDLGGTQREETIRMAERDLAYSGTVPGSQDAPDRLAQEQPVSPADPAVVPASFPTASSCPREAFIDQARWSEEGFGLRVKSPPAGGFEEGDRVISVNGRRVSSVTELRDATPAGRARITLVRGSRTVTVALDIGG